MNKMAPPPLLLSTEDKSTMANKTHLEFTDPWSLYEDRQAGVFAWIILGLMFGYFIGMVLRDMVQKTRTRELQDEFRTFGKLIKDIVLLPRILFTKDHLMPVWYSCTNIFRLPEEQRYWKTEKEEDRELRDSSQFNSKSIIERLGGGWPKKRSQTSSELGGSSQDTDIEMQCLPKITDLAGTSTGLPRIEKLAVVFEVPEILSSNTNQKHHGFQTVPLHGPRFGTDGLSNLTATFNFQSSKDQEEKSTVDAKEKGKLEPIQEKVDAKEKKDVEKKTDAEDGTGIKSEDASTKKDGE